MEFCNKGKVFSFKCFFADAMLFRLVQALQWAPIIAADEQPIVVNMMTMTNTTEKTAKANLCSKICIKFFYKFASLQFSGKATSELLVKTQPKNNVSSVSSFI